MSNIRVCARVRPTFGEERSGEISISKRYGSQKSMQVRQLEFSLDYCFDEDAEQEDVFEEACREVVSSVLDGFNATIMAYGQTGSGKTHTMFGPDEVLADFANSDESQWGIVPRACQLLFDSLGESSASSPIVVQASYIEVYNDRLHDLLGSAKNLVMHEARGRGVVVDGLTMEMVSSATEVMDALERGNAKRVVAKMSMNPRSSRGHAIFTIYVRELKAHGSERSAKLHLVDLAGMESSKKSYAVEGASNNPARREEAKNINQSLYALGSVIERLSAAHKGPGGKGHVPWRDSKLTRLLQDSLGGNSRSAIIVTLRDEVSNVDESLGTLRFAQRAKAVKLVVKKQTFKVKDTEKLVEEFDEVNAKLEASQLLVQQLEKQLAQTVEQETEELRKKQQEYRASRGRRDTSSAEDFVDLMEVAVLNRKNRVLRQQSILNRIIHSHTSDALDATRERHADLQEQVSAMEEIISQRDAEISELKAQLAQQVGGGGGGGLGGSPDGSAARGALLRSGNSVRFAQVAKRPLAQSGARMSERNAERKPLSAEAQAYDEFHQRATARKLNLASRGFEFENIFIDQLYEKAVVQQRLPQKQWHVFLREEMPSPPPTPRPGAEGADDEYDDDVLGDGGGGGGGGGIDGADLGATRRGLGLRGASGLSMWRGKTRNGGTISRFEMPFAQSFVRGDSVPLYGAPGYEANQPPPSGSRGPMRDAVHRSASGRSVRLVVPPTSDPAGGLSPMVPISKHGYGGGGGASPGGARGFDGAASGASSFGGSYCVGTRRERAVASYGADRVAGRQPIGLDVSTSKGSMRWVRTDAARAATVEAHVAADAAVLVAAAARESASRAAEAQALAIAEQRAALGAVQKK